MIHCEINVKIVFHEITLKEKFQCILPLALYKNFIFSIEILRSKKKKLALTLFYYVIREIWLGNSKMVIYIDQSRFYIFSNPRELKNV